MCLNDTYSLYLYLKTVIPLSQIKIKQLILRTSYCINCPPICQKTVILLFQIKIKQLILRTSCSIHLPIMVEDSYPFASD